MTTDARKSLCFYKILEVVGPVFAKVEASQFQLDFTFHQLLWVWVKTIGIYPKIVMDVYFLQIW